MDLRFVYDVMSRRRRLVVYGLAAAFLLAVFAYGKPSVDSGVPTLQARTAERWQSESILFITAKGFPWGRAVPAYRPADARAGTPSVLVGDQDRLASLAALYSQLASSDAVRQIAGRRGRLRADVTATPVTYSTTQFAYPQVLPLVKLSAETDSPADARAAVARVGAAFRVYIQRQQAAAGISPRDRVVVNTAKKPEKPVLVSGPSMLMPVILFLAMAALVVGLVLVLDNWKRGSSEMRLRGVDNEATDDLAEAIQEERDSETVLRYRHRPTAARETASESTVERAVRRLKQ